MNKDRRRVQWGLRCVLVASLVSVVAIGAPACSTILGTSSYFACSAPDAGWYQGDCLACVQANCCDQAAACASDPSCSRLHDCMGQGYPELACALDSGVVATATSARLASDALTTCATRACPEQCNVAWGCAGRVPAPPTQERGLVPVTLVPTVFDLMLDSQDTTRAGLAQVSYCYSLGNCMLVYDGGGVAGAPVRLQVPAGFQGYLDVTPIPQDAGMGPPLHSLVYLSWPIVAETTIDLRLLTQKLINLIGEPLGVEDGGTQTQDTGTLVVLVRDCQGNPASGVTLRPIPGYNPNPYDGSDAFTFSKEMPVPAAGTQNVIQAPTTTSEGIAGWSQIDPTAAGGTGLDTAFTASINDGGIVIATFLPLVQSQSVTYVWLTPTAAP